MKYLMLINLNWENESKENELTYIDISILYEYINNKNPSHSLL